MIRSSGSVLRALLSTEWQQLRGHSYDPGGPWLGLPGALGLPGWNELISSHSVDFTCDVAGLLAQE